MAIISQNQPRDIVNKLWKLALPWNEIDKMGNEIHKMGNILKFEHPFTVIVVELREHAATVQAATFKENLQLGAETAANRYELLHGTVYFYTQSELKGHPERQASGGARMPLPTILILLFGNSDDNSQMIRARYTRSGKLEWYDHFFPDFVSVP